MASITNRSNYLVTVEGEPSLTQRFAFSDAKQASKYRLELLKQGKPAVLTQLEDRIQIRIRDQGYPVVIQNVSSYYQEAEDEIERIRVERKQGRRVDYHGSFANRTSRTMIRVGYVAIRSRMGRDRSFPSSPALFGSRRSVHAFPSGHRRPRDTESRRKLIVINAFERSITHSHVARIVFVRHDEVQSHSCL